MVPTIRYRMGRGGGEEEPGGLDPRGRDRAAGRGAWRGGGAAARPPSGRHQGLVLLALLFPWRAAAGRAPALGDGDDRRHDRQDRGGRGFGRAEGA